MAHWPNSLLINAAELLRRPGSERRFTLEPTIAELGIVDSRFDPDATVDGPTLAIRPGDDGAKTPALVSALVAAGAEILEVRQEMPALEDVYLHLLNPRHTARPEPVQGRAHK